MKKSTKFSFLFFLILNTYYLILDTRPVFAVICNKALGNCTSSTDPQGYFSNFIQGIISIFFIVAVIYFIWHFMLAGYHIISSQGDPKSFDTAKNELTYAFIGLAVVFSVFAILKFVGIILGLPNLESLTIPWPTL